MPDTGVVEPPPRRGPEPVHAVAERLERAVDPRQDVRVVGIRLQEAQRLVQPQERPGVADGNAFELGQERELAPAIVGAVARGGRLESLDEAAPPSWRAQGSESSIRSMVSSSRPK